MEVRDEVRDSVGTRSLRGAVIEAAVAFVVALGFVVWCVHIRVDPMLRVGQVAGLATLQLRFLFVVIPLVVALIAASKVRGGAWFPIASRVTCAALAGLVTAFVAGGIMVALRGTPWCLNANHGDSELLVIWANAIERNYAAELPPPLYPPVFPYFLHAYMNAVDLPGFYALKHLQILLTTLTGPVAYLSWRMLLRPGWALGIGLVSTLIVLDPYKPYENIILIVFVPLIIRFLQILRRADTRSGLQLARLGALFGIAFGALCLSYSGWFRWSAIGVVIAGACLFPWRTARTRAVIFGGVALLLFSVLLWNYLTNVSTYVSAMHGRPLVQDDYIFFDVKADPAYFAMWKGDLPGVVWDWPPPGELAGVGLFSALLFAGLGVAIALGRQRTAVIAMAAMLGGTWLQRFWYAHNLFHTKLVQLYPRTTVELIFLFVVLSGFAMYYIVESLARRAGPDGPLRQPSALIGAVCALVFLFGSMASQIADRFMPRGGSPPYTTGWLAWQAHQAKLKNLDPLNPGPSDPKPPPTSAD